MTKRSTIAALLVAAGTPALLHAQPTTQPRRPNVLFFAVDDLRPELGAYGNTVIKSPNIDRLAARGITFNRAYVQQAVCSPSRTSLLTGTRPDTNKVWDLDTHFRAALPDVVTLPQHFKDNGYFVRGFGKIYHGGFDDPKSWSVPWENAKAQAYALPENREIVRQRREAAIAAGKTKKQVGLASRGVAYEGADVPDDTFLDGQNAGLAIAALKELKAKDQPFFLAVGFAKPHLPFVSPKKYWDLYDPSAIPPAPNPFRPEGAPPYAFSNSAEIGGHAGTKVADLTPEKIRTIKHGYYAAISYMDAQVGRVLDELKAQGLDDNTIVVLWGDHGWKLNDHGAWAKFTNYEIDTRAPLLISVPGQKTAGAKTDAIVEFVDVYPTLADLAGLPLPAHLEGKSARANIADPSLPGKPAAFSQFPRNWEGKRLMGYSIRTDRHRLTRWLDQDDHAKVYATELYDHQTDPLENVNVAERPENATLVESLAAQLAANVR